MRQGALVGRYTLEMPVEERDTSQTWQARLRGEGDARGVPVTLRMVRMDQDRAVRRLRTAYEARLRIRDKRHVLDCVEFFETTAGRRRQRWACLAQEWVPQARTLRDLVGNAPVGSETEALGVGEAAELLLQAASGLRALHGAGLVHGSLRPEALFVRQVENDEWLLMLGALESSSDARPPGAPVEALDPPSPGSPRYRAPESWSNEASPRTDAYALGLTFYELFAGRLAFETQFAGQVRHGAEAERQEAWRHWHTDASLPAQPLRSVCSRCPDELAALVDGLCRKDPGLRTSIDDVVAALRRSRLFAPPVGQSELPTATDVVSGPATDPPSAVPELTPLIEPSAPPAGPLTVIVLGAAGSVRRLDMSSRSSVVIGRKPGCDVLFHAERDRVVSGHHAKVTVRGARVCVEDTGSANGTWVNGVEVQRATEVRPGDVVRLGQNGPQMRFVVGEVETQGPGASASEQATSVSPAARDPAAPAPAPARGTSRSGGKAALVVLLVVACAASAWLFGAFGDRRSDTTTAEPSK